MFAYCNNNPVAYVDSNGNLPISAVVAIVLGALVVGTVIQNIIAIVRSNNAFEETEDSGEPYSEETEHCDMDEKKMISYIRKIRAQDETLCQNWSEAEMLREMKYHKTVYKILDFVGFSDLGTDENPTLLRRVKETDFETVQTAETYLKRFFGNILYY